ncbi:MAG: hypothetical protein D4R44_07565 [Actinobacteria bacterium]|nr:MAG: hypothetical protein D4R44_07565 [Actinomycetota bacterium]
MKSVPRSARVSKCSIALAIATAIALGLHPVSASADGASPPGGSSVDVSSSVRGDQIIAGVEYGASPAGGGGADDQCEWSPTMPRDASATGPGLTVTKRIGATMYKMYEFTCPDREPPTTFYWLPQITTEQLAQHASSIVYDSLPALWGNFAPPARRGFVNVGTWVWVNPLLWIPVQVTASIMTPMGRISVTTRATPKKLIFNPGDGNLGSGPITCNNPGLIWMSQFGDRMSSPCMYTYHHSSATQSNGLFEASVAVQWHVTWSTNLGASGTIGELTLHTSHQMNIREVQALISHSPPQ